VTGFWVAAHVVAIGAAPTPPTQQLRDIYSIVWPYVEIQEAQVGGDIPAISQITLPIQSDRDGVNPVVAYTNRVVVGLRSMSRGANFNAYINFSDEQNPANITVAAAGPGAFATSLDGLSSTGRIIAVTNPGAGVTAATIQIDYPLTLEYHGKFHVFVRARQTSGSAGDVEIQLVIRESGIIANSWETDRVPFTTTTEMLDFGVITLNTAGCDSSDDIRIRVVFYGDGAADVNLYDIVFIPVDEWAADCVDWARSLGNDGSSINSRQDAPSHTYLDIDGISCIKTPGAMLRFVANDRKVIRYQYIANSSPVVQENARQRLWFVSAVGTLTVIWQWATVPAYIVNVNRNQQYLSMRGAR